MGTQLHRRYQQRAAGIDGFDVNQIDGAIFDRDIRLWAAVGTGQVNFMIRRRRNAAKLKFFWQRIPGPGISNIHCQLSNNQDGFDSQLRPNILIFH